MLIAFTEPTELLKEPNAEADFVADVGPFESVKSTQKLSESDDKTWFEVEVKFEGGKRKGWVRAECTRPADASAIPPIRPWVFLKNCTLAARVINAMHSKKPDADPAYGVNRDYLLAWAWLATKHPDAEKDELYWTFNLRKDEWDAFVADKDANDSGYAADDFADPAIDSSYQIAQCYAAAYVAYRDHMALSKAITVKLPPGSASGPYIPNSVELLLAHATSVNVAVDLPFVDKKEKVSEALKQRGVSEEKIKMFAGLLELPADGSASVADAVQKLEVKLDDAYQKTRELLVKYTPEDVAVVAAPSDVPPWVTLALKEEADKITEHDPAKVPHILDYFKATGFTTDKMVPWCGAFVAWCLTNCGNETAAKSVRKATAARAASWRAWGTVSLPPRSDKIPVGAVVVLSPSEKGDSSGHVGFFIERSAGTVTLLGGNQSDQVMKKPFPESRIAAIKWINWSGKDPVVEDDEEPEVPAVPDQPSAPGALVLGPLNEADWKKYKDVLGKRESNNKYEAVNQIGFCGRWQLGAGALIDLGYVRKGASTRKLKVTAWVGKDGISGRAEFLANKNGVQDKAILAYTMMNYKRLLKLGTLKPGDSKARVVGVLAAAHLTGPGGANLLVKSKVSAKDGNGVPSSAYFALLSKSFGGSQNV